MADPNALDVDHPRVMAYWLGAMRREHERVMNYEQFLIVVSQHARAGFGRAELATRATLETLAERIAAGDARDLAERLPPEPGPFIATTSPAEAFDADEFVRRVAEREDVDAETAEWHVQAVFEAVARAVGEDEYEDFVAELSKDYWPLLPRTSPVARSTT